MSKEITFTVTLRGGIRFKVVLCQELSRLLAEREEIREDREALDRFIKLGGTIGTDQMVALTRRENLNAELFSTFMAALRALTSDADAEGFLLRMVDELGHCSQ